MKRYFFNLHHGKEFIDNEGSQHPNMTSVREEAVEFIAYRLQGNFLNHEDTTSWILNVTDESGLTVLILSISAKVQVVKAPHALPDSSWTNNC